MTEDNFYQKYRGFIPAFYTITIAVTSGFGIQYLLLATGGTVLYRQFMSLAIGSGLAVIYSLTEAKNIRLEKQNEQEGEAE
jgi:hypothetical protein